MFGIERAVAGSNDAVAAGLIVGGLMTVLFVLLVVWVLLIIARWKIFTKAGEAGWKSIIPIYAEYVQWRISWNKIGLFWAFLVLVVLGSVLMGASGSYVVSSSGQLVATGGGNEILGLIGSVAVLVACILQLISVYKLMCAYGHGAGWFILYILFSPIMLLVLGFGSSRYIGPQDLILKLNSRRISRAVQKCFA